MPIHGNGGHAKVVREIGLWPAGGWIIAVGDNKARKRESKKHLLYAIAIHDKAYVSTTAEIGMGTVVMAGAVVQAGSVIGRHCIINTGATVDHDCIIGDFAHIAPGVHLCGSVRVGEGALMGVGSCAIPGAKIKPWSLVRAGSVVR